MASFLTRAGLITPAICIAAATGAQTMPSRSSPTTAAPAVSSLEYRSAFVQYQRFADPVLLDWRSANEAVNRIGGWRAYARMSAAQNPTEGTTPSASILKHEAHGERNEGTAPRSTPGVSTDDPQKPAKAPHSMHHGGAKR